jgi:type I restriction enzyme R subunit
MIDRAVASSEIIDGLHAAGVESPDISILSNEFLAEIPGMERKNLALHALQRLLNGEIRSRVKTNVVESRTFSRRLEDDVARYPADLISAVEMINELIALAKRPSRASKPWRGTGLSEEEVAFYNALAQNERAIQAIGSDTLRPIVHELLEQLNANATVDWYKRERPGPGCA